MKPNIDSWYEPKEKKDHSKEKSIKRHALKQVDRKWKGKRVLTPKEAMAKKMGGQGKEGKPMKGYTLSVPYKLTVKGKEVK